jgi:chromosome segregation ATPase
MSKDLTQNLNGSLEDKVDRLIIAVESMDSRLGNIEARLGNVEERLGDVEARLGNVEGRLGNLEDRLGSVEDRLGSLETKVEERLKDTRPMWEAVQTQIAEVESSLRTEIQGLRAEMEKGFRIMDRRLEHYYGEVTKVYAYERELEDRVDKIEKGLNP